MPYALTSKASDVAIFVKTVLEDNAASFFSEPIQAVFYGDQDKIPSTPAVCVEVNEKSRTMRGAQKTYTIEMEIYVIVYHSKVQSPQDNRLDADVMSEQVEALLHKDNKCGGLVIDSFVSKNESGTAQKAGSIIRSNRITFYAISAEQLPQALGT